MLLLFLHNPPPPMRRTLGGLRFAPLRLPPKFAWGGRLRRFGQRHDG